MGRCGEQFIHVGKARHGSAKIDGFTDKVVGQCIHVFSMAMLM
jgi:hypothetical protein